MKVAIQTRPPTPQLDDDLQALQAGGHDLAPFCRVPFTADLEGFDPTAAFLRCTTESLRGVLKVAPSLALYDHEGFSLATLRSRLPALNAEARDLTWSDLCASGWRTRSRHLFVRPTHDLKSFPRPGDRRQCLRSGGAVRPLRGAG